MDEFQRSFFLFRQNEWEDYKGHHENVIQGDLADPFYFDFISFCQYAIIAEKMKSGKLQFVEKVALHLVFYFSPRLRLPPPPFHELEIC